MKIFLLALVFIGYVCPVFSVQRFRDRSYKASAAPAVYREPELHASIRARDVDLFTQLLPLEKDLNLRNSRGQSPLVIAMLFSDTNMLVSLLKNGSSAGLNHPVDQQVLKFANRRVKKILKKYNQIKSFCQRMFTR